MNAPPIAAPAYFPAPLNPAPAIPDYPQFTSTAVPPDSNAKRSWTGTIQPFTSDSAARRYLRCVEGSKPFDVIEGTIDACAPIGVGHWADPWLVSSEMRFQLLVFEFEGKQHPLVYSLRPEISRNTHPLHPHLRDDRPVRIGGRLLPALCVYSAPNFEYSGQLPRIVQFLDQTATYIGRHIIWLKTRIELPVRFGDAIRVPEPGEHIFDHTPILRTDSRFSRSQRSVRLYSGYWPGPTAPCGFENHLHTIAPTRECWCGSGEKYGACHRPFESNLQRTRQNALSG